MPLTGKQKSHLRSLAQTKKPLFQVGKDGVTQPLIQSVTDYVVKNELVKIGLLETCPQTSQEVADIFASQGFEVVQIIGKIVILFLQNRKLEHGIILPR
jgi:RNA-binding protein